jgi:hypothetical protein
MSRRYFPDAAEASPAHAGGAPTDTRRLDETSVT